MLKDITIMEMEDFVKRIEILLEKEMNHLDYLLSKRIQFLNKKCKDYDWSIEGMITVTSGYIDYYSIKLEEYSKYVEKMNTSAP